MHLSSLSLNPMRSQKLTSSFRSKGNPHDLLLSRYPTTSESHDLREAHRRYATLISPLCTRRRFRHALSVLAFLCVLFTGIHHCTRTYYPPPPLYGRFHAAELALPQHDPALPPPEGRYGRYLFVTNHAPSESTSQTTSFVHRAAS